MALDDKTADDKTSVTMEFSLSLLKDRFDFWGEKEIRQAIINKFEAEKYRVLVAMDKKLQINLTK